MGTLAKNIIAKAESYLGTKESPANSNNVIFNTDYYGKKVSGSAYPWCCAFVWDIFKMCSASKLFCGGAKTAYCPTVESYAKSHDQFIANTKGKAGDLCLMDFGKGRASHIGIVKEKNSDGTYKVVEGNTSTTSNDNGGSVMLRTRNTSVIRGFYRPEYDSESTTVKNTSTSAKKTFIKAIQTAIGAKIDGIAGTETLSKTITLSIKKNSKHKAVKAVQTYLKELGYSCGTVDGIYGSKTASAVKKYQKEVVKASIVNQDGIISAKGATWKRLLGL